MEITLSKLCPGETGTVLSVRESPLSGRLRDLGCTEGSRILFVRAAPLGDPLAFRIRGALIALRKKDADTVTVSIGTVPGKGGRL